jgi:hypothetical protein
MKRDDVGASSCACPACGQEEGGVILKGMCHNMLVKEYILQRYVSKEITGRSTKNHVRRAAELLYARRGSLQGPTAEGGLSNLLPSYESDMLHFASKRDCIIRTNLQFCRGK